VTGKAYAMQAAEADYIQQPRDRAKNEKGGKTKWVWKRKKKSALGMVHDATAALAYATGNDSSFFALPTYARLVKLL